MMANEDGILLEKRGQIGYITFNRPEKLNPLRNIEYDLLDDLVNECERDDDIRAVIITGKGRSFCAGDDMNGMGDIGRAATTINTLRENNYIDWELKGLWHPLHLTVKTIYNSGKIYIGAVNGICWMAELLYPLDFVIAADIATFAQADIRIGICPGGGSTQTLTRALGRRRALELLLLPEQISAQEAYRIGLVNKVVPLADLIPEAEALARKIIIYSPKTIAMIKRAVTKAQDGIPIEEALRLEQLYSAFTYRDSADSPWRKEWRETKGK
jgi:enoyl-CoA hydratase